MDETTADIKTISSGESADHLFQLADDDLLSHIHWKSKVPAKLAGACHLGDPLAAARLIRKRLRESFPGLTNSQQYQHLLQQLLWSRHAFEETPRCSELIDFLTQLVQTFQSEKSRQHKSSQKLANTFLESWLQKISPAEPASPFELLILQQLLICYHPVCSLEIFWQLWRVNFLATIELNQNLEEPMGSWPTPDQKLLVQGELAWKAGIIFQDVRGSGQLLKAGRKALRTELEQSTDTDGTPKASLLPALPFWLACYVRSLHFAKTAQTDWQNNSTRERFADTVDAVIRLLKSDGSLPFANESAGDVHSLLRDALKQAGIKKSSTPGRLVQSVGRAKSLTTNTRRWNKKAYQNSKLQRKKYAEYTLQSDWGELAQLRSCLEPHADMITVAHQSEIPRIEFSLLGQTLFSGEWNISISRDGQPVSLSEDWFCSCFSSDVDADYLELKQELEDGLTVERQIFLSRTDHLALFADAVTGAGESRIDYSSRLPLTEAVQVDADVPTRECIISEQHVFARLLPLDLPQDRVLSTPGRFGQTEGSVELQQAALGGLYAPLLISWHPRRKRDYVDWKKLTVTEDGQRLKSNAAAGHRLRMGSKQWLLYRNNNNSPLSRSVLGYHTQHEMMFGQFDSRGDVQPLLLVK